MKAVTINAAQRLFVIPCGDGFSCLGFDNCYRDALAMAQMMNVEPPDALSIGTMACYDAYLTLCGSFSRHPASKDIWFTPGTPERVRKILKSAIKSHRSHGENGQVLRVFNGDSTTGRDWCLEWDVVGYVGCSTGSQKIPLLLEALYGSDGRLQVAGGGTGLLTDSIIRIIDVATGKELYRATNYQMPEFEIAKDEKDLKLPYSVSREGAVQARFGAHGEACEHVAFMTGVLPARTRRSVKEYEEDFADQE